MGVAVLGLQEKEKEEEEEDWSLREKNTSEINKVTVPCQCNSVSSSTLDSPLDQSKFKEPFSAPF